MSRGINKVILMGYLGQDPDVRYMPDGNAVANVSVATSEAWKNRETGEKQERTEWHRLVFYRRLAEIAGEYLRKGARIYVEGKLRTRKWTDQSGQDRYTTEIVVDELNMLDSAGGGSRPEAQGMGGSRPSPAPSAPSSQGGYGGGMPGAGDYDDDIPFCRIPSMP